MLAAEWHGLCASSMLHGGLSLEGSDLPDRLLLLCQGYDIPQQEARHGQYHQPSCAYCLLRIRIVVLATSPHRFGRVVAHRLLL
jgi:hypothetical protein